jgi:GAF domain-containing protein
VSTAEDLLAELGALAAAIGPALAPPGTERLLASLTETARALFGARACSLALLTDDETELVYTTAAGAGADGVSGLRMPADRGIAGWVAQSGQAVAIDDLQNDARFARDVAEDTGYVPQAILAVPVSSDQRLLGVLSLLDRDSLRPGAESDMVLLTLFADQAAIALEGARAFSDLGRILLGALGEAVTQDQPLADALAQAAVPRADAALTNLATLFAELGRHGPAERALAVTLVRDVLSYVGGRSRRPGA